MGVSFFKPVNLEDINQYTWWQFAVHKVDKFSLEKVITFMGDAFEKHGGTIDKYFPDTQAVLLYGA